jgi:glycosyltransferase involved in cell wall biosynthesis
MSETAGEGACLVDPTDSDSIRSALDRIVADASFRSTLIARGFENVKRYQAAAIARQYLAVYEQVLGNVEATLGSVEATAVEVAR